MLENAKIKVKKIIASLLASASVIIPSAKFIQRQLEAPEADRENEENLVVDDDKNYEQVYEELEIGEQEPETETFEEETKIDEQENEIETFEEETKIDEQEPETETLQEETKTIEEILENDETFIYLKSILETKNFEDSMKKEILDTYIKIYQNYDIRYAYEKMSKEVYLRMFCDTLKDKLNVAELVEEHDKEEPYAKLLEEKEALGLTKGDTIYLQVDTIDRVEANFAHELWHLLNQGHKVLIGDNAIDISVDTREGLSAYQESFVVPLEDKEVEVYSIDENRTIKINMDIIQYQYQEYLASYPGYKNNTERLIALVGMGDYMDIVHSGHDYIASLRAELSEEFEQDKVDEFIKSYVVSTCFLDKNGIKVMDRIDDRCDSIRLNIMKNEELLQCTTQEEFYAKWEEKIKNEEETLSNYQNILEEYKNLDMSTEYITSTIKTLENAIYVYRNTVHVRKDLLENNTYESMRDLIEFEIEIDEAKIETFEKCKVDEQETIWEVVINLENDFNTLMVERIDKIHTPDEIAENKATMAQYVTETRIICLEGERDITLDNFTNTVAKALQDKEKEFYETRAEVNDFEVEIDMDFGGR